MVDLITWLHRLMHEKLGWKPLSGFWPLFMQKCDTRQDRW
jgi:hypothetical protein